MMMQFQPGSPLGGADSKTFTERALGVAAFVIPLVLSILTACPEVYWLDSPELTAAVITLGVPHPPGHPLYILLAKVFTLLPFGNLPYRVSLASAVFGACAAFLLFKICFHLIVVSVRTLRREAAALLSLGAALTAFVTPAWWFQCVRQEVYSLQILLTLGAFYPALMFCLSDNGAVESPKSGKPHLLILSAFFTGLGLSCHHFVAAATLPSYIPMLVALSRTKGGLGATLVALKMAAAAAFGLLPYALLPAGAPVALGGVHSWSDLWFVLSAKEYQKSMMSHYAAGFDQIPSILLELKGVGLLVAVLSLLGVVLLFRAPRTRSAGLFIALFAVIPLILRATLKLDPFEPDFWGYLLPIIAASAIGLSVFAAVTLHAVVSQAGLKEKSCLAGAALLVVLSMVKAADTRPKVDLSSFHATRLMTDFSFDAATPGTLVLPADYNLFYALSSARFLDGTRPDLTVVNPLLLAYPGYLHATLAERSALAPLAHSVLVHGDLTETALVEAALAQPVLTEATPNLDDETIRFLLPEGPLYRAQPQPSADSDVTFASAENAVRWKRFLLRLGTDANEPETRRMLFSMYYRDALYSARRGDIPGARVALDAAFHLNPSEEKVLKFRRAIQEIKVENEDDAVDVKPFLPENGE